MAYTGEVYRISASSDTACGYIVVTDITTYPVVGRTRDQFGKALFWSIDNFAGGAALDSDLTNPGSNTIASEWQLSALNKNTYSVKCFTVPVYDDTENRDYASLCICLYEGIFYVNSSGGNINSNGVPFNPVNWTDLSVGGTASYGAFFNALDAGVCDFGYDSLEVVLDCPSYTLVKQECYDWLLTDTTGTINDKTVYLYDFGTTNIIETYTLAAGSSLSITIPNETDGLYYLLITETGAENIWLLMYEYCKIITCYDTLIKEILCREFDPCCEECDEATKEQERLYRSELNKIVALHSMLVGKINYKKMEYLGDYTSTFVYDEEILNINNLIIKLNEIVGRCGDCTGAKTDTITPCTDCN